MASVITPRQCIVAPRPRPRPPKIVFELNPDEHNGPPTGPVGSNGSILRPSPRNNTSTTHQPQRHKSPSPHPVNKKPPCRSKATDGNFAIRVSLQSLSTGQLSRSITELVLVDISYDQVDLSRLPELPNLTYLGVGSLKFLGTESIACINQLESLATLDLGGCRMVNTDCLKRLTSLSRVCALVMNNCPNIGTMGIKHLSKMKHLERVVLADCPRINSNGLAYVSRIKSLRILDVSRCTGITSDGMRWLASLPELEELVLDGCVQLNSAGLTLLATSNAPLNTLSITGCRRLVAGGLAPLLRLRSTLSSLNLNQCVGLTENDFRCLGKLTRLETLNLGGCKKVKALHLRHIESLPCLSGLNLEGCAGVGPLELVHVSRLPGLNKLGLHNCTGVTKAGLVVLSKGRASIRSIHLTGCLGLSGDDVDLAYSLPALENLFVGGNMRITAASFASIADASNLKALHVVGSNTVDAECMKRISKSKSLEILDTSDSHGGCATKEGLANLASGGSRIKVLCLRGNTDLTAAGLDQIQKLPCIDIVDFGGTGIKSPTKNASVQLNRLESRQVGVIY